MKEVSIIGATFYGNRGAEAMLCTTICELDSRFEEPCQFHVFSYYPENDASLVDKSNVRIFSCEPLYLVTVLIPCALLHRLLNLVNAIRLASILPQSVKALASSDIMICLAGVSFVDGRTKFLPFNICTLLPAILLDVPVVKFSQALGPFERLVNRIVARQVLKRCARIFTRGERTHRHVRHLLSKQSNYQRADDTVFSFRPYYCLSKSMITLTERLQKLKSSKPKDALVIGICPSVVVAQRARAQGWDYPQRIANIIEVLSDQGHRVALYPNATRDGEITKTHNNDLPLLDDIEERLSQKSKSNTVVFTGPLNARQIYEVIQCCDLHVTSRFHAMIAALGCGIPVMVIGWSHKYLEVLQEFNQQDMAIDYQQGSMSEILALLNKLQSTRETRRLQIVKGLSKVRMSSKAQFDFAESIIRGAI